MWYRPKYEYEHLFIQGKYKHVLNILESSPDQTNYERITLAYVYSKLGDERAATSILNLEVIPSQFNSEKEYIMSLLFVGEIYVRSGKSGIVDDIIEKLDHFKKSVDYAENELISQRISFLKGIYYTSIANFKSGRIHLNKSLKIASELGSNYLISECKHELGLLHRKMGDFTSSENYYLDSLEIKQKLPDLNQTALTLNHLGNLYAMRNKLDKANEYYRKIIHLQDELDNDFILAMVLNNLGILYEYKGELDQAITFLNSSLDISKRIHFLKNLISCYINLGSLYDGKADYEQALRFYRKANQISTEYDDQSKKAKILINIGVVHKSLGNLKQAEYYYLQSLSIANEILDQRLITRILNNLGVLNYLQGKIPTADNYLLRALEISKEINDELAQGNILSNLGLVSHKKFEYEDAKLYYIGSLRIREKTKNEVELSSVLFHLIGLESEYGKLKSANNYMKKLKEIAMKSDNNLVKSRMKVAEANLLQHSDEDYKQLMAHDLIEEVLSGDYVDFELHVFAMFCLCEYLIWEIKKTDAPFLLDELEQTVETLYTIATENESHDLIAKTLLIQVNIALVKLDTSQAVQLLQQAHNIAENHQLEDILLKVNYLENQVQSKLFGLLKEEDPIGKRMDDLDVEEYVRFLYYHKQTTELLKSDISNIRRFNAELANLLQSDEGVPLSMQNLARVVEFSGRELQISYSSISLLKQILHDKYEIQQEKVKLGLILQDLVKIYRSGMEKYNLDLEYHNFKIEDIEDLVVPGDSLLVERVLDNLLINAIKFSKMDSYIRLSINQKENMINLIIDNSSSVIPEEALSRMFEIYQQYSEDNRIVRGYGIGLTFCKLALTNMGHEISIHSPIPKNDDGFRAKVQFMRHPKQTNLL